MKRGMGHGTDISDSFIRRVDSCQYYHALPIPKSQTRFAGCEASGLSLACLHLLATFVEDWPIVRNVS